jgi:hypothetical protein
MDPQEKEILLEESDLQFEDPSNAEPEDLWEALEYAMHRCETNYKRMFLGDRFLPFLKDHGKYKTRCIS